MIKRLLALDGVLAVCRFRDDGGMVESYGVGLDQEQLRKLSLVAHDYRRMLQGHADQFSMFSNMRGWTPPRGWAVRGETLTLCGVAGVVCILDNRDANYDELLRDMLEVAHW